jgi:hypothetical protein
MYRRAESSRAEMLELQRAERRLALEEAGLSPDDVAAADAAQQGQETDAGEGQAQTNAVAEVKWKGGAQEQSGAADADEDKKARRQRARDYVASFGPMIDKAEREGRAQDAARYRRVLMTFVPDYVDVYGELISEAHAANREDDAKKACAELLALVPEWLRVGTMVELLNRDEGYFSRVLSADGLATKDEFVKAFRRRYDKVRREQGDKDERVAKMERICKVLATYVPDFERSPEWK